MSKPNDTFQTTNSPRLDQSVIYLYDPLITGFRQAQPSDFSGGGGTGSNLNFNTDSITAYPFFSSSATQGVGTGIGVVLTSGQVSEKGIQNIGTTPIYVSLNGAASPSNFSFILQGGNDLYDGNGASWKTNSFYGAISVSGSGINYSYYKY